MIYKDNLNIKPEGYGIRSIGFTILKHLQTIEKDILECLVYSTGSKSSPK